MGRINFQRNAVGTDVSSYDSDAQAFFTAVEGGGDSLTTTEKTAVNQRVLQFKARSIWSKLLAYYPMVGGTLSSCKWNLKDPRNLDAAFRLTYSGTPTASSTGLAWGGSTYGDTFIIPSSHQGATSASMAYYSRTNDTNGIDIGATESGDGHNSFLACSLGGLTYSDCWSGSVRISVSASSGAGHFYSSRTAVDLIKVYRNGSSHGSNTGTGSDTRPTWSYYLGANNRNGTGADIFSTKQCASATFTSTGLDDTEISNDYTDELAFQTALSRNV